MLVDLRSLQPNSLRDFTVDPIDPEAVKKLKQSIGDHGFWGGIVCREKDDGSIQICAGHHRVKAAIEAGYEEADLFVGNGSIDDASMLHIYGVENATQRGNTGTAQVGTVAAAIRYIAWTVLRGVSKEFLGHSLEIVRGQIQSEKGIGMDAILTVLHCDDPEHPSIPGINKGSVPQALLNLKTSGNYERIIREVKEEIDRDQAEALAALALAEQRTAKASEETRKIKDERKRVDKAFKQARREENKEKLELERQRIEAEAKLAAKWQAEADEQMKQFAALKQTRDTAANAVKKSHEATPRSIDGESAAFDFEGVAKHLKNAHQIDAFRKTVLGDGVKPYLPRENQAKLAAELVKMAKKRDKGEPTAVFIRENIVSLISSVRTSEQQLSRAEKARLEREDLRVRARNHLTEFMNYVSLMDGTGQKILRIQDQWPKGEVFPITEGFRRAVQRAKHVIDELNRRI